MAQKAYFFAPLPEQKKYFRTQINSQVGKLIMHQYASEVIEYVYSQTENEVHRKEMVYAFYGQYFLLLKQMDEEGDTTATSLIQFCEKKPQLADQILEKIESIVQKLVEKGMSRHSIVQAIICDYVLCQKDQQKIAWLAESMKEKLPSLLASKQGLTVACILFNVLDTKDRKMVVKSLQEPLKEMVTNKIAYLFIVHVLNNLDDTVISKKKILQDVLLTIDENVTDRCFINIFLGIYSPKNKRYFQQDEIECLDERNSTSKKDAAVRRIELMNIVTKPLETFFEENMLWYLQDTNKCPLLAKVFAARIELGEVDSSDAIDEMFRKVQTKHTIDNKQGQILLGHPDLHRVLKELVKLDSETKDSNLNFSIQLSSVLVKNMDACLNSRAAWIFVELLEHDNTKEFVKSKLVAYKHKI